jgi:tetratricopeptide (TPR) repeat protein
VVLREESLELPTYRLGPPEDHPVFFDGRSYQGAKGPVYPYPLLDKLGTSSAPQAWRAVRLENEYLQVVVLPEIGGRIFTALDKTNGYDFFYRQHVIKPALIGMAGAWISGGVEWNVFHHHRVTSFMPVECTFQEHPDGSKTVWIGETELRHRMRWVIGLTLRPGRSTLEATLRFFNRTDLPHSFLYFANPAVAVNDRYQVIFPPRTEWAASHTKDQFVDWPVGRRGYNGVDYRGVDLSWIRNHPKPNSFFAWNTEDSFIAGYDHGRKAGVMHVADPRIVPGKKLWQWGMGPTGRMWERILTDADGPYAEIMVGAWSDNQPDYSWIQPGEVKTFTQVWYPIRELGGVKDATAEAAVELEPVREGVVRLGFNATAAHREARAVLSAGDQVVFDRTVAIAPDRPFAAEVPLPAGVKAEELRAVLAAKGGRELVAYAPVRRKGEPMPETYRPPAPPRDIQTVDELAFAGSRLEQFYNPHLEPDPYYEEALRRDPGDVRANTSLGLLYLKRGMYAEARARFREALKRATGNHTKARDGAPHFYLGVALRALGKEAEAAESFARASWDGAFAGASWRALAELAGRRGDWADALNSLDRALSANVLDTKSFALRAAVLRRAGRPGEALRSAGRALALDPLDPFAMSEQILSSASGEGKDAAALRAFLGKSPQPYLELACDYDSAGMAFEALHVLGCAPAPDAMIRYHHGWLLERTGHAEEAAVRYREGAGAPWEGCFPSRFESAGALRAALKADPGDARARLYLGNLFYDHQPEAAVMEWEEAVRLDPGLVPAHRNLGFAYLRRGEADAAVAAYGRALAGRRDDPLLLVELDQAGEAAGLTPAQRLKPFEENRATALRKDRAAGRLARLQVLLGRFDEAIDLLTKHHFHLWEGEAGMYGLYVEARARRGEKLLAAGRADEALMDFEEALRVPPNIEVWAEFGESRPRLAFLSGLARKVRGRAAEAKACFEEAAGARGGGAMAYYAGRALAELGRPAEAEKVFAELVESSRRRAAPAAGGRGFREREEDRRRRAEAHYAAGLGLLGLGRVAEARAEFGKAVRLDASHPGACRALARD